MKAWSGATDFFPRGFTVTITVNLSSHNLDYFDALDLSGLDALSLDFGSALVPFDAAFDGGSVTRLTSSRISISNDGYAVNLLGRGISPTSSVDALGRALESGTARGTLTGLTLTDQGTEVVGLSLTASSLQLRYDDLELELTGTFPTGLGDVLSAMIAIVELSDPYFLSNAEIAEYEAALAGYQVSGMSVSQSGSEIVSVSLGRNVVSVKVDDFTIEVNGLFPTDLGSSSSLTELLPALLDGDGDLDPDALNGLRIDNVTLLAPNNAQILRATGDFIADLSDPYADETYLVDGVAFDHVHIDVAIGGQTSNRIVTDAASSFVAGLAGNDTIIGNYGNEVLAGNKGSDILAANGANTVLQGGQGSDRLRGSGFADELFGGDGADTIFGAQGDDFIFGGDTSNDKRDLVYGGGGNDRIDGGHGNDELRGDAGNDTIAGGFGADTILGGNGDDVLTGSSFSDRIIGGQGKDFINGGFGFDRLVGGSDADQFFHVGVRGHGSDWVQDYDSAEGDVLRTGIARSSASDYLVRFADTGAGDASAAEAFVSYRPTGQILWVLIDGAAQDEINLQIGGQVYDLLA